MPLNMETYYVINAEENWNAEMRIRVEGYIQKYSHTQRIDGEPYIRI